MTAIDHAPGVLALAVSIGHIIHSAMPKKVTAMSVLSSAESILAVVIQAAPQVEAFAAGNPLSINIPKESITIDLTAEGIGKVSVSESGTVLTFQKSK